MKQLEFIKAGSVRACKFCGVELKPRNPSFCDRTCACRYRSRLMSVESKRNPYRLPIELLLTIIERFKAGESLKFIAPSIQTSTKTLKASLKHHGMWIDRPHSQNTPNSGRWVRPKSWALRIKRDAITDETIALSVAAQYRRDARILKMTDECNHWSRHPVMRNHRAYKRIKASPQLRLKSRLRCRIYKVLSGRMKSAPTLEMLGCSLDDLKIRFESMFRDGMNWKNMGHFWHIDHIIPCSAFNLSFEPQQRACFHFSNLQPLLADENRRKSNKIKGISL